MLKVNPAPGVGAVAGRRPMANCFDPLRLSETHVIALVTSVVLTCCNGATYCIPYTEGRDRVVSLKT